MALNSILRMMLLIFIYFTTQHSFTSTNRRNATGRFRYSWANFSNLSHCTISSIMSTNENRNNSCYSSLFFKSYEWRCICVCCSKAPVASVALLYINILFEYKDWSTWYRRIFFFIWCHKMIWHPLKPFWNLIYRQ